MAGAGMVALPPIGSARAVHDSAPHAPLEGVHSVTASPTSRRWGKRRHVHPIPGGGVRPAAPIWLGTADWEDPVRRARPIHELVPEEDLNSFDIARTVREIEKLEAEARAQEHAGKYEQAQELLEKSVELRRSFLGESHEESISAAEAHVGLCNQWGLCFLGSGNYTHALLFLKKAEALTEASALPNSKRRLELRAATFNNMACYFRARGKLSAALQCMEKSLTIKGRCREADNLALLQLNYAGLLSMANRPQEALDHIEVAKAALVPGEQQLAQLIKKSSFSRNHFQLERRHQETVALLSVAHYNAWIELSQLGHKDAAVDSVRRAINIVRWKLGETHPLTSKVRQAVSMAEKRVEASSTSDAPSPRPSLSPAPSRASSFASRSVEEMAASSRWRPRLPAGEPWPVAPPMSQSLGLAAVEPAERVTMRCSPRAPTRTPGPPAGGPPPQERPRPDLVGQVYKRPQGLLRGGARTPLFSDRPRIEDGDGYVGSALVQQRAHGVRPLSCATAPPSPDSACMQDLRGTPGAPEPGGAEEAPAGPGRLHAIGYLRDCQAQGLVARPPTEAERARAATRIQALCRGHIARKGARGDLPGGGEEDIGQVDSARRIALEVAGIARWALVDHNAAVAVQRVWRGHQTRHRIKEEVALVATTSAIKLQRFFRRRHRGA